MDNRHRVYYLANLHQNWYLGGWWARKWDSYGVLYHTNLNELKRAVPSLKIRPVEAWTRPDDTDFWQMKLSCKREDEHFLSDTLRALQGVDWARFDDRGDICEKYIWWDNNTGGKS